MARGGPLAQQEVHLVVLIEFVRMQSLKANALAGHMQATRVLETILWGRSGIVMTRPKPYWLNDGCDVWIVTGEGMSFKEIL